MELYLYDFSEIDRADVGPHGLYEYPYLDHYWVEEERYPFLVWVNGRLAGFALVSRYNYLTGGHDAWVIAEFFVMRKYRRQGVGEAAAWRIFELFPGDWQVAQLMENAPATAFWRKVIGRYTGGGFEEVTLDNDNWRGPVQKFESAHQKTESANPH
jgi:predicted acetyltransferase